MKRRELSDTDLLDLTKKFSIHISEELYKDQLSYEEVANVLMDLAEEFYENGEPDPKNIDVKVLVENDYGEEV
jgi:hypothetical protein